jgi:hypothetical protein
MRQEITDSLVVEILAQLYGRRPAVERLGGGTNLSKGVNMQVYAARFGADLADRVIKLPGEGRWKPWALLDEQLVMRALRDEGIPEAPEIEYTQEDINWFAPPFLVMRRVQPGASIETAVGPDYPNAESIWRQAGALRARLSAVDWRRIPRARTPCEAAEQILRFLDGDAEALDRLPEYRGLFDGLLAAVRELALAKGEAFGQGDPAEILTCDDGGLALVDFSGFVGAHRRLREPGSINGMLRWRYPGDARVVAWHEEGFFAGEVITHEMRQELTIWEIYALVSNAGWLTALGRQDLRDRQLAFARQRLVRERPV